MACSQLQNKVIVNAEYLEQIDGARDELRRLLSPWQDARVFVPLLLRLAFHDAGTYDARTKRGGANGSIQNELTAPPNGGIDKAIQFCEPVKSKFPLITYADLYQLAGVVAVEHAKGPIIEFVPGRQDNLEQHDVGGLPNPDGGVQHLRDIFHRMGFNDKEIVLLSGAHTLGRAHRNISGFDGDFTLFPQRFDNLYYQGLLTIENPGLVKFPTDRALTQDPVFRAHVVTYANDQAAFFRDYAIAHKKMSELGFQGVRQATGCPYGYA